MKRKPLIWLVFTFLLMVGYPWLVVCCAPAESAMGLCFLLFYLFAPIFSIAAGFTAGGQVHSLWYLAILPAFFFIIGTWLCFDMGETDFLFYGTVYLVLAAASALLSFLWHSIRKKKKL